MRKMPKKMWLLGVAALILGAFLAIPECMMNYGNPLTTDANCRKISRSMTVTEVEALLGQAETIQDSTTNTSLGPREEWRVYTGRRNEHAQRPVLCVRFRDGRATEQ